MKVGDQVWLLRKNIKTTRPSQKLDFRKLGPYRIISKINDVAFRLQLPAGIRLHPVFHVSLLEKYNCNDVPGRFVEPPPPIEVDDELEYEVESILDSKIVRGKLLYLVDWLGYDSSETTWEPVENLTNAQNKVKEFHERYPNKPRPATSGRRRLERR